MPKIGRPAGDATGICVPVQTIDKVPMQPNTVHVYSRPARHPSVCPCLLGGGTSCIRNLVSPTWTSIHMQGRAAWTGKEHLRRRRGRGGGLAVRLCLYDDGNKLEKKKEKKREREREREMSPQEKKRCGSS